jgi:hypothetical protein
MLQRLQEPDDEHPDPRGQLDQWLETALWPTPMTRRVLYAETVEPGAPSWWHGDEEASQSFFKSMGIDPEKLGR